MRRNLRNDHGVTLVELMVVIALIAVLAALVGPSIYNAVERAQAKGVARDVAQTLRTARNQAQSRGEIVIAKIYPGNSTSRGKVELYGTDLDLRGGSACSVSTDCAPGTYCSDTTGTCLRPARNCRQYDSSANFIGSPVYTLELDQMPGNEEIAGVDPTGELTLCFSPDGRVLDINPAGAVISGGSHTCSGENWIMWVADADATSTSTAVDCDDGPEAREPLRLYRISVPYNGSITVQQ